MYREEPGSEDEEYAIHILEKIIEIEPGDECDDTIGETCHDESDKCVDHRMSGFFEFFFFACREDHLDSRPRDREDREDRSESDEPGDDRSDGVPCSLIIDWREESYSCWWDHVDDGLTRRITKNGTNRGDKYK